MHAGRKPEVLSSHPIIKTSPALWQNTADEPLLTQSSNKLLHVRGTQVDGLEILEELLFADLKSDVNTIHNDAANAAAPKEQQGFIDLSGLLAREPRTRHRWHSQACIRP